MHIRLTHRISAVVLDRDKGTHIARPSTAEDQLSKQELCKAVSLAQSPFSMEECKADSLKRCRYGQGEEAAYWSIKDIWRNLGRRPHLKI